MRGSTYFGFICSDKRDVGERGTLIDITEQGSRKGRVPPEIFIDVRTRYVIGFVIIYDDIFHRNLRRRIRLGEENRSVITTPTAADDVIVVAVSGNSHLGKFYIYVFKNTRTFIGKPAAAG